MIRFARPLERLALSRFAGVVCAALMAGVGAQAMPLEGLSADPYGISELRSSNLNFPGGNANASQYLAAPTPFEDRYLDPAALDFSASADSQISRFGGLGMRPFEAGLMGHGEIEGFDSTWFHGNCSYYCREWAVPEPSRLELTIAGSAVLLVAVRRRRRLAGKTR
jgi:hypothetical protein